MDISPRKSSKDNKRCYEKSSLLIKKKTNEMPSKLLELKHQNSALSTDTSTNNKFDLSQRIKITNIKTKNWIK